MHSFEKQQWSFGVHCWYLHADAHKQTLPRHIHTLSLALNRFAFLAGRDSVAIMYYLMNSLNENPNINKLHVLRSLFTQIVSVFVLYVSECATIYSSEREEGRKNIRKMNDFREERGKTYSWIARYRLHSNFIYVQFFKRKIIHREREIRYENTFSSKHTYRSSKNINFNSMLARNINIFKFNLISVIDDDGNEWPTATNPKFCTQLWPSPYPLSIWNTRAFK